MCTEAIRPGVQMLDLNGGCSAFEPAFYPASARESSQDRAKAAGNPRQLGAQLANDTGKSLTLADL
jgi:hypothetical protein